MSSRVVRGSWIGEKIGCVKKKKATASPGSSIAGAHTARLNQWCSSHPPKDPSGPADSTIDGAAYARSTLLPPGPPWCIVSRPHSAPTPRRRGPPGGAHSHKDGGSHHPPGVLGCWHTTPAWRTQPLKLDIRRQWHHSKHGGLLVSVAGQLRKVRGGQDVDDGLGAVPAGAKLRAKGVHVEGCAEGRIGDRVGKCHRLVAELERHSLPGGRGVVRSVCGRGEARSVW